MHIASLLAAMHMLVTGRDCWHGTVIAMFQPNEEHTRGAQAMIDDGLYEMITVQEVLLVQHVVPLKTETVAVRPGVALLQRDEVSIRVFGDIGYKLNPALNLNPAVLANRIHLKLDA